MIEKERSANNPRIKVNIGQPKQRVYTKVTKNIKQKEEQIETNMNHTNKESNKKNVYETKEVKNSQENNKFVKPTSTRQSVEVDKITELLKSSSNISSQEVPKSKDRKEKISTIATNISQEENKPKEPLEKKVNNESSPSIDIRDQFEKEVTQNRKEKSNEEEMISPLPPLEQPKSNFLNYLLIIAVLIMGFFTYQNSSNMSNPTFQDLSKTIQNQYVLKSNLPEEINGKLKFNNLPNKIQEQYVLKDEMIKSQNNANMLIKEARLLTDQNQLLKKQIEQLKLENRNAIKITQSQNKNRDLLKENALLKKEQESYSSKIVTYKLANKKSQQRIETLLSEQKKLKEEITKLEKRQAQTKQLQNKPTSIKASSEVIKTKIASPNELYYNIVQKEVFPAKKSTSKNFKLVKCYDLPAGAFYLSQTCKKDITRFLKANAHAKRFEVIGVVDQKDFTLFSTQDPSSKKAQELQKYSNMGLARYRVLETSWLITDVLGDNVVLTPVNYTITSKKNNRGSIIRAYYK